MVAEHITNLASIKNSGKRSRTQMLVVHSAETPLAAGYAASVTTNWLNRSDVGASINAFFGPDTTVRSVNTDYAAWHATWANAISVGYEFTGYAALTRAQWLTDAGKLMLDRAGREMAADANIYGIPLRYLSTAEVNQIAAGNTTIKGIATHRQIDPTNRTDPGDGFPYDVLLANARKYAGVSSAPATPTTKPVVKEASEMPKYKRVGTGQVPIQLGQGTEWFLKDKYGKYNENYGVNGYGHYLVDLFVQGDGLPAGESVTVTFWLVPTGGKRSAYFEQEIVGSTDGVFKGSARFNMPVVKASRIEASVKATTAAKLTHYAADVTTWAL